MKLASLVGYTKTWYLLFDPTSKYHSGIGRPDPATLYPVMISSRRWVMAVERLSAGVIGIPR